MRLRHKLLRWLAMGDLVLLNAEIFANGAIRQKECGGVLISNVRVASKGKATALYIAEDGLEDHDAALTLERLREVEMADILYDGRSVL